MAIWREQLLPHIVDKACSRRDFAEPRRRALTGVSDDVVEVGFGSGHNLACYPSGVCRVLAVEPSTVARHLAEPRVAGGPIPVQFVGLDGQGLALPDECADAVVSTVTVCTIPDVVRALGELARVLRPGGRLHFVEHALSPDPRVAAWQHRLTPLQNRVFGGCHVDRPIAALIAAGGFKILTLGVAEPGGVKDRNDV